MCGVARHVYFSSGFYYSEMLAFLFLLLLVPERQRVLNPVIFFLSSKSASTDWLRNNKRDVASRRKLAPRRRGSSG